MKHEIQFASKMVMLIDVVSLNDVLCKWSHRTKRQSKTTKRAIKDIAGKYCIHTNHA